MYIYICICIIVFHDIPTSFEYVYIYDDIFNGLTTEGTSSPETMDFPAIFPLNQSIEDRESKKM